MSVGGRIIENIPFTLNGEEVRKIWVVARDGDETAIFAEPKAEILQLGEEIWWQQRMLMARSDKLVLKRIGYSFDPNWIEQ